MTSTTPMPDPELDTIPQFSKRANISTRTTRRKIDDGTFAEGREVIRIGRAIRIDPVRGMQRLRGELPPPEPVRRGRPKKNGATASPTATVSVAAATRIGPGPRTRERL